MPLNIERFVDRERAQQIKTAIRSVLMQEWDPIGVKDEPMAADEYDGYIGGVYELLKQQATPKEISDHLRRIAINRIGYAESQVADEIDVAESLKRINLG